MALVSDFLGDAEPLLALAREKVAGGTEVFAVHLVDPMELEPGEAARVVTDPENPAIRRPLGAAELEVYRGRFAEWRHALARNWRGAQSRSAAISASPAS